MTPKLPPGWRRVRLGDVLQQVNRFEPVEPDREYRLLGVKWYAGGVFERERKLGREIAAKQLNRDESAAFAEAVVDPRLKLKEALLVSVLMGRQDPDEDRT